LYALKHPQVPLEQVSPTPQPLQLMVPPQPSLVVPQLTPGTQALGVQQVPDVVHFWLVGQVPQFRVVPHPSDMVPQVLPAVVQETGEQHAPLELQTCPAVPQGVPAGTFGWLGEVPTQRSSVQGFWSLKTSVASAWDVVLPLELQTRVLQSPAVCCAAGSGVPAAR
jgi:hypothetical protein